MKIVLNSMVTIHLAKLSILEQFTNMFDEVIIPKKVFEEIIREGYEKGYSNSIVAEKLIKKGLIKVVASSSEQALKELEAFGLKEGEAEAVAIYFQEKADRMASDNSTVRKNRLILNLNLIGTPAIIYSLFEKGIIEKAKTIECLIELKKIGWFKPDIIDSIIKEVMEIGGK
ncbi:MAG: hypothetical protein AOA65_1184 [Candidatus Bathyarchaeota archaeon BA1]|nr:MAG: hypothetical protein AOA65_1184 [Candidatus Bathyarchaeota archaeon BA1]